MRRALLLAAIATAAAPAAAPAADYRLVADPRGTEAGVNRTAVVAVERDGRVVATFRIATTTLRGEAGRRLRLTLRRRPLIEFRQPFQPPSDPEPDVHLIDLPLFDLFPEED